MADKTVDFKIRTDASGSIKAIQGVHTAFNNLEKRTQSLSANCTTHFARIGTAIAGSLAVRELIDFGKRSIDAADSFNKLSQRLGVSVEDISAYTYAAKLADVTQEGLATGVKKLSKNMFDAAAGTGEAKDAFAAMGLSVKDATGGLKTTSQMLEEVAEKFSQYEDSAAKTALAQKIFGKSGADLIPFLNQGKQGLAEATKEGKAFGVVIGKEAAEAAERFNDNITRLKEAAGGFANKVMADLLPAIERYSNELVTNAKNQESMEQAAKNAASTIVSVGEKVRGLLDIYSMVPPELVEAAGYGIIGRILFGGWGPAKIIAATAIINDLASKGLGYGGGDFAKKYQGATRSFQNVFDALTGKRDWRTGALRPDLLPGAYEPGPYGYSMTTTTKTSAPTLPDKNAADNIKEITTAQLNWKQAIEALNPVLDQEEKAIQQLSQQAEDLKQKWGDQSWIEEGRRKGEEYIKTAQAMKRAEEEISDAIKLSEEAARIREDNLKRSLDLGMRLLDVDTRRIDMNLQYDKSTLGHQARYGQASQLDYARQSFDLDVRRLENMRQQLTAQIQLKSEMSSEQAPAEGILELLLERKLVEEEINRLLGLRSTILKEHEGTTGEGFATGWNKYFDDMGSEFQRGVSYAKDTASAMHNAFEEFFFDPVNYSWDNLWKSMQRVASRAMSDIAMNAIHTLGSAGMNWLFGAGGGQNYALGNTVDLFSFHKGGIVGEVPRLHKGLMPGEYPAILQRGEGVFTPGQMKALGRVDVTVNVINNAGAEVAVNKTQNASGGIDLEVLIDNAVASKLSTFGSASNKAIRQNYDTSQRLTRR